MFYVIFEFHKAHIKFHQESYMPEAIDLQCVGLFELPCFCPAITSTKSAAINPGSDMQICLFGHGNIA